MPPATGVVNTPNRRVASGAKSQTPGAWIKKHRTATALGAIGGVFLFMSHKGSTGQGSSASTRDQLQAQQDAIAAQESAALESGALPGGVAPVDTGGGSYTSQGPTSAPNITINVPGRPKRKPPTKGRKTPKPKQPPRSHHPQKHNSRPSRGNPNPGAHGHRTPGAGGGGNRATQRQTAAGHKRNSPVEVESMAAVGGAGSGIMIHGRQFPGAISCHAGPILCSPTGEVQQEFLINYGGHNERVISHGNGRRWTDNVFGNPPRRGMALTVEPGQIL